MYIIYRNKCELNNILYYLIYYKTVLQHVLNIFSNAIIFLDPRQFSSYVSVSH